MEMLKYFRRLMFFTLVCFFTLGVVSAAPNVIDVEINENVYEQVLYNPTQAGSGDYFDAGEVQSLYTMNGTITVTNNHPTEAVFGLVLNFTEVGNITGIDFQAGAQGYVDAFTGTLITLSIPDIGPGSTATFNYTINAANIVPPLNFTSAYGDEKVLAGFAITVTDTVQNNLNSTLYPYNCIENIVITQNALTANSTGNLYNFTFNASTLAGADAGNASVSANNRTLTWNLWNNSCFLSSNTTSINYNVNTNTGINLAKDYKFVNTTITYQLNDSFSKIDLSGIKAILDLDLQFDKSIIQLRSGDNATWQVFDQVSNPTNITVNLTKVTLWVSVRNGTGSGFTNPSIIDNDTVDGSQLNFTYTPNTLLNNTLNPYNNSGSEWFFNYTYSASPIVWMDINNKILDDGVQLTNRSVSYGQSYVYVKEIYIVTGYYLQISKNITRTAEGNYTIDIEVINLGNSPTPSGQVVQVYNFIPNTFNLTSNFIFSDSPWYNTTNTSDILSDPIYNGTMHQFAIIPDFNPSNSSLDMYGGASNVNNTWSVTYNLTGDGQFDFEDLFLTGVDPLKVDEFGATKALTIEGTYESIKDRFVYVLAGIATVVGLLVLFL